MMMAPAIPAIMGTNMIPVKRNVFLLSKTARVSIPMRMMVTK